MSHAPRRSGSRGRSRPESACARCGEACELGPYREQLCTACALELGRQEVEAAQARRRAEALTADVCKTGQGR